jgi:uncharacterized membrane protein YoaK (UPF0700 family)
MDEKIKSNLEVYIHYMMSIIGGFLGGYALLNRCDLFGSAQTSNMIYIVMGLIGKNSGEVLIRIIGLILYSAGLMLTVLIPKYTKLSIHLISVIVDIIAVVMLGFFPENMNDVVALYPLFFITAMQWNAFKGAKGYVSSTIFSTNNLRQMVLSFTEYVCGRDKMQLDRMFFYLGVLFFYHIGIVFAYLSYKGFGVKSSWLCIFPLVAAVYLVMAEQKTVGVEA